MTPETRKLNPENLNTWVEWEHCPLAPLYFTSQGSQIPTRLFLHKENDRSLGAECLCCSSQKEARHAGCQEDWALTESPWLGERDNPGKGGGGSAEGPDPQASPWWRNTSMREPWTGPGLRAGKADSDLQEGTTQWWQGHLGKPVAGQGFGRGWKKRHINSDNVPWDLFPRAIVRNWPRGSAGRAASSDFPAKPPEESAENNISKAKHLQQGIFTQQEQNSIQPTKPFVRKRHIDFHAKCVPFCTLNESRPFVAE